MEKQQQKNEIKRNKRKTKNNKMPKTRAKTTADIRKEEKRALNIVVNLRC